MQLEVVTVFVADSDSLVLTDVSNQDVDLVALRLGGLEVYASLAGRWLKRDAGMGGVDLAVLLGQGAEVVDFSGYYLGGADNPAYAGRGDDRDNFGPRAVSWLREAVRYLPSTAADWRPWPWPAGVVPVGLMLHGNASALSLAVDGSGVAVADGVVGALARELVGERPLTDPLVLLACYAARAVQEAADAAGRLMWATQGMVRVGAEPIDLHDASAGARVRLAVGPGVDGGVGRFVSAWPQGAAGDRVRFAYRQRFPGPGESGWLVEQFTPYGSVAPRGVRPVRLGARGVRGWSYFDGRDLASRSRALASDRLAIGYVSWTENPDYRPGTTRRAGPAGDSAQPEAEVEPWHVRGHGGLPFDVERVLVVPVYFVHGSFLVHDRRAGVSYREEPAAFGRRLARDYAALAPQGGFEVLLLADFDPVPGLAARAVARGLGGPGLITADRPGVLSAHEGRAAGLDETRIALLPWGQGPADPLWTLTDAHGESRVLGARELPSTAGPSNLPARPPETTGTHAFVSPAQLDADREPFHEGQDEQGQDDQGSPLPWLRPTRSSRPLNSSDLPIAGSDPHAPSQPTAQAADPAPGPDAHSHAPDPPDGPAGEVMAELTVEGLDHVRAVSLDALKDRITQALPHSTGGLRERAARKIVRLLSKANPQATDGGRIGHPAPGNDDARAAEHGHEQQLEAWSEAVTVGLWFGRGDALVHVAFSPAEAPTEDRLTPAGPSDPHVVEGTSAFAVHSFTDTVTREKNIGVGGTLEFFTGMIGKATFLAPSITFVPRKQLFIESVRTTESIGGSRLADGPRSTYHSGTRVTISVLSKGRPPLSGALSLPEHRVTYGVRTATAVTAATSNVWHGDVTAPSRLAKFPFALTGIDTAPVLRGVGAALLDAGYTGAEAAAAMRYIAEDEFNTELARRFNQSLLDGTNRSGLIEISHVLGNLRVSLQLTALRRAPDIAEPTGSAVRVDIGHAVSTEDSRAHGYDAPLETGILAEVFGLNLGGGGFGVETSTTYRSTTAENHARKFAANFRGPVARYHAQLRAVVSFDSDSRFYLKRALNPLALRKPVAEFTADSVVGEIVVPAAHAQAFQDAVTGPEPDFTMVGDRLVAAYCTQAVTLPEPLAPPSDGTSLDGSTPMDGKYSADGALSAYADGKHYTRGALVTCLPAVNARSEGRTSARTLQEPAMRALLQQSWSGGVQVVVRDPRLAADLRAAVDRVWRDSANGPSSEITASLATQRTAGGSLHTLTASQLLALFVSDPSIRIVAADGVLISRHNPRIPVSRQYEIALDGRILRSVRTTPDGGYADDVRTPLMAPALDGATAQLAAGVGTGPAITPVAPGLAKVLLHIEQAMSTLMDKRNDTSGLWDLKPALANLIHYQDARMRAALMKRLGAYFGSVLLRSRFGTLLRSGVKITVEIKSRWPWQASRRFDIEVHADLLQRLDGGVAAIEPDAAVDLQAQGDIDVSNEVEQESAFIITGFAQLEIGISRIVAVTASEINAQFEYGRVELHDQTTTHSAFNRLSTPSGPADRPDYLVDYRILITEFDRHGTAVGSWGHRVRDEVSPVVSRAFQARTGAGSRALLAAFADGLDDFWQVDHATAQALQATRLRFDRTGASGVSPHFANLDKLLVAALELVRDHDLRHHIGRDPVERADLEARLREVIDEAYFASHFGRLGGANGMPAALPWLRRMFPRPGAMHAGQISNIKSALNVKIFTMPAGDRRFAGAAGPADATTMSRRHQEINAQHNSGDYSRLFMSAVAGPRFRFGKDRNPDNPAIYNSFTPQLEARGAYSHYREQHTAVGADDFTMIEERKGGIAVEYLTAMVELTLSTRFSKQKSVSTTRSYYLGDGTTQVEMPTWLRDSLMTADTAPGPATHHTANGTAGDSSARHADGSTSRVAARDPLDGWIPVPDDTPGARRPITPQLAYDTAHVHALAIGPEIAARGGVAAWVTAYLRAQQLLPERFLSITDVNHRKLVLAYDEDSLADELSALRTVGVPVHLDIPSLGDKRLTVLLKAVSPRGPRYVRSSGTATTTHGGLSVHETAKLTETEYSGGLGPNLAGMALMNQDGAAFAQPNVAYRKDIGKVLGTEAVALRQELRRITGPEPDEAHNVTTDDFLDEFRLELEVYTDWIPAEPVRFLTSTAKPLTAPLARWGMAAQPAQLRTDIRRSALSLDDSKGFRTPIARTTLPGTVKIPMTMNRSLTEDVSRPPRPPRPVPRTGYRARVAQPRPGALNRALIPVIHGIGLGTVANVQRHVRYAAGSWNSADVLWRHLAVLGRDAHAPAKEASFAPTGNKGRRVMQTLHPRVLRSNQPKVLAHAYPVLPKGTDPGITYGFEASGIARPLPRAATQNTNPMMGMSFGSAEHESTSSHARSSASQAWLNPLSGGDLAAGQPMLPHLADYTEREPAWGKKLHVEKNTRSYDTYVAYEFTGHDMLHSRGVAFTLNEPGSLFGYLRHRDAVALADEFPDQFVHPEAVTVDGQQTLNELAAELRNAGATQSTSIHLFVASSTGDLIGTTQRFARDAARAGHTVDVTFASGADAPVRLSHVLCLPGTTEEGDSGVVETDRIEAAPTPQNNGLAAPRPTPQAPGIGVTPPTVNEASGDAEIPNRTPREASPEDQRPSASRAVESAVPGTIPTDTALGAP